MSEDGTAALLGVSFDQLQSGWLTGTTPIGFEVGRWLFAVAIEIRKAVNTSDKITVSDDVLIRAMRRAADKLREDLEHNQRQITLPPVRDGRSYQHERRTQ